MTQTRDLVECHTCRSRRGEVHIGMQLEGQYDFRPADTTLPVTICPKREARHI